MLDFISSSESLEEEEEEEAEVEIFKVSKSFACWGRFDRGCLWGFSLGFCIFWE